MTVTKKSLLGAALFSVGCYTAEVRMPGTIPSAVQEEQTAHTILYGLVTLNGVKPECTPAVVRTQEGVVGVIAKVLTVGLYTPLQVTVTCAAPQGAVPVSLK